MINARAPIFILVIFTAAIAVVIVAWPQLSKSKEQAARRACAADIAKEQADNQQAIADWEAQCQTKRDEHNQKQATDIERLRNSSVDTNPSPTPSTSPNPTATAQPEGFAGEIARIRADLEARGELDLPRAMFEENARQTAYSNICDIPLGQKPTPLVITPDEELKAIRLCMERKGY